jgi:hypothetical protein
MHKKSSPVLANLMIIFVIFAMLIGFPDLVEDTEVMEPYLAQEHRQSGNRSFDIITLSSRNDMISGGDVLVRIDVAQDVPQAGITVTANGTDVTGAFRPVGGALLGLVQNLHVGDNTLVVDEPQHGTASMILTNYPRSGPIFSGPHEQPFVCTTETFVLPVTGVTLGPALDTDCSSATRVDYVYWSTAGLFKPLPDPTVLPPDVATTTTNQGVTVPFVVRIETGTINRAIYQVAILHDPTTEPPLGLFTRSAGWNGRLIYTFGGGCQGGWYFQGNSTGGVLDAVMLSQGYAMASASLNVFATNCNDVLAAETAMMAKERFIKAYGPPLFTIGWGGSGGSYQCHQISDNYPGVLDGIIIGLSFPDVTSGTIFTAADARLLRYYFTARAPELFTPEQQRAVAGFRVWESLPVLSSSAARLDPTADFHPVIPDALRYHRWINPRGARATVFDHTVNVYGRELATGFARRPLDNVGVQYGLAALNAGTITMAQFLDLNERIGGLDPDARPRAERHHADLVATRLAYQTGRILSGGGGLAATPIIDYYPYMDDAPKGNLHMRLYQFTTRARLLRANGHAANQVMLVQRTYDFTTANPDLQEALRQMDRWLIALQADATDDPKPIKVVRAKPIDLVDACWSPDHSVKVAEPPTYAGPGMCNTWYPVAQTPRLVAGAPPEDDIVKCTLKPIDMSDYTVVLTPAEQARLHTIFPKGVCDWSQPGVQQVPLGGTWFALPLTYSHGRGQTASASRQ